MLIEFTTVNEYFSIYSAQYTALLKKRILLKSIAGFHEAVSKKFHKELFSNILEVSSTFENKNWAGTNWCSGRVSWWTRYLFKVFLSQSSLELTSQNGRNSSLPYIEHVAVKEYLILHCSSHSGNTVNPKDAIVQS